MSSGANGPRSTSFTMKKTQVNLIRNLAILYPHRDADFEHLSEAGTPVIKIDAAFFPVLQRISPGVRFKVIEFVDLEAKMLEKFSTYWPYEFENTPKSITLIFPRAAPEALLQKAENALRKWYRDHYTQLDQVIKRAGKNHRMVLTKRSTA